MALCLGSLGWWRRGPMPRESTSSPPPARCSSRYWTGRAALCRQPTVLRTSALAAGRASAALAARGFTAYSTQRWMQLRAGASPVAELPGPYRFAEFDERHLGSLLATFFAAWPDEDDAMEASRSFRESAGLVVVRDVDAVVGYASWELLPNGCGVSMMSASIRCIGDVASARPLRLSPSSRCGLARGASSCW